METQQLKQSLRLLTMTVFTPLLWLCSHAVMAQQKLTASLIATSSCKDDGTINAYVGGGTAPYTYRWNVHAPNSTPYVTQTPQSLASLSPGTSVTLTIKDASGDSLSVYKVIPAVVEFSVTAPYMLT